MSQGYKIQMIVHLNSQKFEARMVKPLTAGYVNTVVACRILITVDYVSQRIFDTHANQKQEINFVWPLILSGLHGTRTCSCPEALSRERQD